METRAPFIIVGAFVLAAIAATFGFVYWLHNSTGMGARSTYHLQFDGPVPGLLVGASVLFNGIRVGEVTELKIQRNPNTGASRGFGYLTMDAQSQADQAVSRLNDYSLSGCRLKVRLVQRREVRGIEGSLFER